VNGWRNSVTIVNDSVEAEGWGCGIGAGLGSHGLSMVGKSAILDGTIIAMSAFGSGIGRAFGE
jgi:hypothetical protein